MVNRANTVHQTAYKKGTHMSVHKTKIEAQVAYDNMWDVGQVWAF
jgi:hypothetical protein